MKVRKKPGDKQKIILKIHKTNGVGINVVTPHYTEQVNSQGFGQA